MSHEQARQFIQQASEAIQAGQFSTALDHIDRSIALDSSDSEAYVLRGVALSNLNQSEQASAAFQEAIALAPHNSKAFYNFAVHLYSGGVKDRALEMAREASRLDQNHTAAAELASRIERETRGYPMQEPPTMAPPTMTSEGTPFAAPPQPGSYYRPGYYDYSAPVHSLAFIEKMGKSWDVIGWVLASAGGVLFVVRIVNAFGAVSRAMSQVGGQSYNPFDMSYLSHDIVVFLLVLGVALFTILWIVFDIVDRRANWLWAVPLLLGCCCGLHWLVLGLYIPLGRRPT